MADSADVAATRLDSRQFQPEANPQATSSALQMIDAESSLHYLKSAIWPEAFKSVPPNTGQVDNFLSVLLVNATIRITDDTYNPEVPSANGMVGWWPVKGMIALYRYGFVKPGVITLDPGYPLPSPAPANGFSPSYPGSLGGIVYKAELAIPYTGQRNSSDVIQFSPDVNANYAFGRLVEGVIMVKGGATALNRNVVSGRAAMSVLGDTRQSAQNAQGVAYAPSVLAANTITGKDGYDSFGFSRGMVSVQGPDVASGFSDPDMDLTTQTAGTTQLFTLPQVTLANYTYGSPGTLNNWSTPAVTYWLSPWQIQPYGIISFPGAGTPIYIPCAPIDEQGCFNIQTSYNYSIVSTGTQKNSFAVGTLVEAWFASASTGSATTPYNINYQKITLQQWDTAVWENAVAGSVPLNLPLVTCSFDINTLFRAEGATSKLGKFIGCQVSFLFKASYVELANEPITLNFSNIQIVATAPTVQLSGWKGPAHILEWRDVSKDQELVIEGQLNVQVVAQSTLAPFTKTQVQGTYRATNSNVIPLVAHIFSSDDTPIKRNYKLDDYLNLLAKFDYGSSLNVSEVIRWSTDTKATAGVIASSGMHAGLLGDLAGAAGAVLGGPLGGLAGKAIGSLFGAGQFGSYSSGAGTAMFCQPATQAAGMFGSTEAAGMFGSYSSNVGQAGVTGMNSCGTYGMGTRRQRLA